MKKLNLLILAAFLGGCTSTKFKTKEFELDRISFLQKLEIPEVTVSTNGSATLKGYATDGGSDSVSVIVGAAVKAAVQGVMP